MRNNWILNHKRKVWTVKLFYLDESTGECTTIAEAPYKKSFEWEADRDVIISGVEVVDGNGNMIWSQWGVTQLPVSKTDVLKIEFNLVIQ